jgi:hypothetical protein
VGSALRHFRDGLERALAPRPRSRWDGFEDPRGHQRATELLIRHLTPAQRAEFKRTRSFVVHAKSGRQYRITYGTIANIDVLARNGRVEHRLCAGPRGVPTPDVLLAQKLMLETQESEFLRIAIKHCALGGGVIPPWA